MFKQSHEILYKHVYLPAFASEEYFVFPIICKVSLPVQGMLIEHLLFRFCLVGFDSQHETFEDRLMMFHLS